MTADYLQAKWRTKKLDYIEAARETGNETMALVLRAKAQVCEQVLDDLLQLMEAQSDDRK